MAAPLGSCLCRKIAPILPFSRESLSQCKHSRYMHRIRRCFSIQTAEGNVENRPTDDLPVPMERAEGSPPEKIVVPKRIKREPTDILKALSSTVDRDFNSPGYPFIDDPYLLPKRNLEKRMYMAAKASGKRAAQYVVQNYPHFFKDDNWIPNIEAFMPQPPVDKFEQEEGTLEGLEDRIAARRPEEAVESYKKLQEEGVEIPQLTYNRLLDVLCAYNCTNPLNPDEELLAEERWAVGSKWVQEEEVLIWKKDSVAEQVFAEMPEKNAWAYSSLVQGMVKHKVHERALDKFQEMKSLELEVDLDTYNAVILTGLNYKMSWTERWNMITSLLTEMRDVGLKPDLNTFNNALNVLAKARMGASPENRNCILQLLSEMKECGIEPSLTTWTSIIMAYYGDSRGFRDDGTLFRDIIEEIEGQEVELCSPDDAVFFTVAMDTCTRKLHDLDLAYRIENLLQRGRNQNFAMLLNKESGMYHSFILHICKTENMEKIMEEYNRICTHVCQPTFKVMFAMFEAVDVHGALQHIPRLYSDILTTEIGRRKEVIQPLLVIMAKEKQEKEVQDQLVDIAKKIQTMSEEDAEAMKRNALVLTCKMMDQMIMIHLNGENLENALGVYGYYKQRSGRTEGILGEKSLVRLTAACADNQDKEKTMELLEVMANLGYELKGDLMTNIKSKLSLSEEDVKKLKDLFPKRKPRQFGEQRQ